MPPPPLTEGALAEAEQQFGVTMPDGYRQFLLRVGSGGPGPVNMRPLARGPDGWGWVGDRQTDLAALTTPFPDQDSYQRRCDALDDARPQGPDETAWADWARRSDALERGRTAGALHLSDDGCGFFTLLVVSGAERGTVWFDRRATSDVIVPLRNPDRTHATFADFYLDWLTAAEQALAAGRAPLRRADVRAPIYAGRFDD